MFFDWGKYDETAKKWDGIKDGTIDHVAMYVGQFTYNGKEYNVVQASSPTVGGIIPSQEADLEALPGFVGFGRVNDPRVSLSIKTNSPIDLIVTDPDGITITPDTVIETDEEQNREVLGELYYSIYDMESDGTPKTEVFSPHLKMGNYIIRPVKRDDAPAGSVYSITVVTDVGSIVIAKDVPIDSIPPTGYGVTVEETGLIPFIPADTIPPTTTASVTGTLGAHGWYTSNVSVTLTATDTESGVATTSYSLDNGATWLTYSTMTPITITTEGSTSILYYSTDKAGNREATHTLTVKIDKTPPEVKISVDLTTKDLKVEGVDTLSSATVSRDTSGNYTITDDAGHTTKLFFQKTYTGKLLTYAKLTGVQYDQAPVITIPTSSFLYVWNPLLNPPVLLSQTIVVNDTYGIEALYDKKNDKTTVFLKKNGAVIQQQVFPGLHIVKLTTSSGTVGYEF